MQKQEEKEKEKRTRVTKPKSPYLCPRCGYNTSHKPDMRKHLAELKKICPALINDIDLTPEIIQKILDNRVYKIPKETKASVVKAAKQELIRLKNDDYFHYIYLVRPENAVINNNNIYKIGKSIVKVKTNKISRLLSYGSGSEMITVTQCSDANILENLIIASFKDNFRLAYGNEFFIGDKNHMIQIIYKYVTSEKKKRKRST